MSMTDVVGVYVVNFEQIPRISPVFLLLILNQVNVSWVIETLHSLLDFQTKGLYRCSRYIAAFGLIQFIYLTS